MEFLEKLYSNENFGIYLLIVIAVLIVLFFVILFFGKKDEKTRKNENKKMTPEEEIKSLSDNIGNLSGTDNEAMTNNLNVQPLNNEVVTPSVSDNAPSLVLPVQEVPLENPQINTDSLNTNIQPTLNNNDNNMNAFKEITEPVKLEAIPEHPVITANPVFNDTLSLNEEKVEEKEPEEIPLDKTFDFDALADAINKELEAIEKPKDNVVTESSFKAPEVKPVIEEKEFSFPNFEQVKEDVPPIKEDIKQEKKVMPQVFSSVYVNKDEKPSVEPKPPIELPKKIELPKMADNQKVEPRETFTIKNVLDSLEEESFKIDK